MRPRSAAMPSRIPCRARGPEGGALRVTKLTAIKTT
jgi:hypothetical protein